MHFMYFSKAYDRVPRQKLMMCLKKAGCGLTMLMALVAMYQVTRSVLGMVVITAEIGVRQVVELELDLIERKQSRQVRHNSIIWQKDTKGFA